jgi:hypothetical protein
MLHLTVCNLVIRVLGCTTSAHNREKEEDSGREMDLGKKRGSGTGQCARGCSCKQRNPLLHHLRASCCKSVDLSIFLDISFFPFAFVSQVWLERTEGGWYMMLIEFYLHPRLSTHRRVTAGT